VSSGQHVCVGSRYADDKLGRARGRVPRGARVPCGLCRRDRGRARHLEVAVIIRLSASGSRRSPIRVDRVTSAKDRDRLPCHARSLGGLIHLKEGVPSRGWWTCSRSTRLLTRGRWVRRNTTGEVIARVDDPVPEWSSWRGRATRQSTIVLQPIREGRFTDSFHRECLKAGTVRSHHEDSPGGENDVAAVGRPRRCFPAGMRQPFHT
jgi:hypothetical protein